jgi:hypothetical protein
VARPGASARRAANHATRCRLLHVAWLVVDYFASHRLIVDYFAYAARPGASARCSARLASRCRLLRLRRASLCLGTSCGTSRGSSSTTSRRAARHAARRRLLHVARLVIDYFDSHRLVVDYFTNTARLGASARGAAHHSATLTRTGSSSTTSPTPRVWVPRHVARLITRLVVDYFAYAARPGASARRAARSRLLRLHRMSRCLGTSCGSSRRSSSTTSPTPCVRVPRHVAQRRTARLAARRQLLRLHHTSGCLGASRGSSRGSLSTTSRRATCRQLLHVAQLVIDYFASCRLVVDYFATAARPGASARRAARHAARHRQLRLLRTSGCLDMSRGSLSTTSRRAARRRLLRLAQAYRRLLRLRLAFGCLGTSRDSSRRSSSTTSPTLHVRVPRHVAWLVT